MKIKQIALTAITSIFLLSCSKDEEPAVIELAPQIQLSIQTENIEMNPGDNITITAVNTDGKESSSEWKLDGKVVGTANQFNFDAKQEGSFSLVYTAKNNTGEFTKNYTIIVGINIRPITKESNAYVVNLFEFLPAPGQNTNRNIGDLASAKSILSKKGMVSLGAYGGYIVLGFDHTVINRKDQDDFVVYANGSATFSEPGIVWVMRDENGNGKPDDTWYELAGSEFGKEGYERNYTITYHKPAADADHVNWTDNKGGSGQILNIKKAAYFPASVTGTAYSLSGSKLRGKVRLQGSFYYSDAYDWGYADNSTKDNFDISNAVDKDGNKVNLSGIDFVKVQTGVLANMGLLGELSTEVLGIADLSIAH